MNVYTDTPGCTIQVCDAKVGMVWDQSRTKQTGKPSSGKETEWEASAMSSGWCEMNTVLRTYEEGYMGYVMSSPCCYSFTYDISTSVIVWA